MTPPKKTPPAATEGAEETHAESDELSAVASAPHESIRSTFDLESPPGLVGDLASYFYASARYPMKEGAMLAALGLMAGITGREFNFDGTGLNLYLLLLAESGRGKEDMDSGIERVLGAVRQTAPSVDIFMGPNTFASGQALIHTLGESPSFLSIQGEFGLRLKQLNDPRAPSSTTLLRQIMLDLYAKSGWGKVLRPMVYSDRSKNSKAVASPAVTILGESTPGHVYDNLSFRDIEDGLLPRCLILECDDERPRSSKAAGMPPNPDMINRLADVVAATFIWREKNQCQSIVVTDEARHALQAMQDDLDDRFNDKSRDPADRVLWNRAALNVKRIAALIAIGRCQAPQHVQPVIEKAHVDWALRFVSFCVEGLARRYRNGLIGNGESRLEGELRKYIREYVAMNPFKRNDPNGYRVPQKIMYESHLIPYSFLRRRASQCPAFITHPRGLGGALNIALDGMCKSGALMKIEAHHAHRQFGTRQELYALGTPEEWGVKPKPKQFFLD
jgi:hypothetical protein